MSKYININESSIIDLKAELFRKEEKFKHQQATHIVKSDYQRDVKGSKTLDKIAILTGKKKVAPKRKLEGKKDVTIVSRNDDAEYEKAKLKLESKAKLYDKMSTGAVEDPEEDGESFFLVDFHQKVYGGDANVTATSSKGNNSEDEWVEFEDSLGRQRKCLKKDLEKFKSAAPEFRPINRTPSPPTLLSEDARREMMKKKWEEEQEMLQQDPFRDIHYQNVLFDEVRDHGVAYYQFSKDEAERKSQMEALNKLREQTIEQRAKRELIKEKRKAALDARIAKIKQKKALKEGGLLEANEKRQLGLDHTDKEPDKLNTTESDRVAEEKTEARTATESTTEGFRPPKSAENPSVGEHKTGQTEEMGPFASSSRPFQNANHVPGQLLDSDKRMKGTKSSATRWINEMRDERVDEFAPPSFYYQEKPTKGRTSGSGFGRNWTTYNQ